MSPLLLSSKAILKNYAAAAACTIAVLTLGASDMAYRGSHRGIMVGLALVPAFGLLFPKAGACRWRLLPGGLAFLAGILVSLTEWRSRPFIVLFTLADIVALTWVVRHLCSVQETRRTRSTTESQVPHPREHPAEHGVWRINDVQGEFRRLSPTATGQSGVDFHDVRVGPFGTRLLMVGLEDTPSLPKAAAAELLTAWRLLAGEEASLAELARKLDSNFSKHSAGSAKALLITISSDGEEVDLVCCGRRPPYVLADGSVAPVSIFAAVPAIGRIAAAGSDVPIYVTRLPLSPGKRLLVFNDALTGEINTQSELSALVDEVLALNDQTPSALLDLLADALRTRLDGPAWGDAVLMLIENRAAHCTPVACAKAESHNATV